MQWIPVEQAAETLGVSSKTVRALIVARILPAKLGSDGLVVDPSKLDFLKRKASDLLEAIESIFSEHHTGDYLSVVRSALGRVARKKGYLPIREVALNFSVRTRDVKALIDEGKVKSLKIGQTYFVKVDDGLDALLSGLAVDPELAEAVKVLIGG